MDKKVLKEIFKELEFRTLAHQILGTEEGTQGSLFGNDAKKEAPKKEEEKYATILLDYIKNNAAMKNIEPKFRIGKLNLNFTNPDAIGFCGERPGDSRNKFFEGAIVNGYVKDYSLEKEIPLLCALNDDAKWWERK